MNDIFEYLYTQKYKKGIVPTLDRVLAIFKELDLNFNSGKIITIAGTNGKGSVSAVLTSILENHNKTVCRFNSPHLYDITERFYCRKKYIDKTVLEKILTKLKMRVDEYQNKHPYHFITFFEYMFLASMYWFERCQCDYIILEVGMGGRFDATNIVDAEFSAITSISLDHISYLGDTIEKIAFEKAGIIKKGQICVLGNLKDSAKSIVFNVAKEKKATVFLSDSVKLPFDIMKNSLLKGEYQVYNFKTSFLLAEKILGKDFDKDKAVNGIKNAYWPARYEKVCEAPLIIRDVAHNTEGMKFLKKSLENDYGNFYKIVVFAVMKDKDYHGMLKIIDDFSDLNIFTSVKMERALPPNVLGDLTSKQFFIEEQPLKALKKALMHYKNNTVIIITGSVFLMEELNTDNFDFCKK